MYIVGSEVMANNKNKLVFIGLCGHFVALIYLAVGLYDTHSFEWPFLLKFLL